MLCWVFLHHEEHLSLPLLCVMLLTAAFQCGSRCMHVKRGVVPQQVEQFFLAVAILFGWGFRVHFFLAVAILFGLWVVRVMRGQA